MQKSVDPNGCTYVVNAPLGAITEDNPDKSVFGIFIGFICIHTNSHI